MTIRLLCLFFVLLSVFGPLAAHPLDGRIWSVAKQGFISEKSLLKRLHQARFTLLGETHDNAEHHRLQARLLGSLDAKRTVVLEMLTEQQAKLVQPAMSTVAFFQQTAWAQSGWPDQAMYQGVIEQALRPGSQLQPGNLDRERLKTIIMHGAKALPQALKTLLDSTPLSKANRATLQSEIIDSHCGMLPDAMVAGMMLGQRSRDALMAHALLQAPGPATLIAGSGHARNDYGVAAMLAKNSPDRVLSLAWLETQDDMNTVSDYAQALGGSRLPYDVVWFTSPMQRDDPCIAMRDFMSHHHAPPAATEKNTQPKAVNTD